MDWELSETQAKLSFAASRTRSEAWTVSVLGKDQETAAKMGWKAGEERQQDGHSSSGMGERRAVVSVTGAGRSCPYPDTHCSTKSSP